MFTVEFEHNSSFIRSLDESGEMDDVELILDGSDTVYMRQWDENLEKYEMLVMTSQQLLDLVSSLHQTEGLFMTVIRG